MKRIKKRKRKKKLTEPEPKWIRAEGKGAIEQKDGKGRRRGWEVGERKRESRGSPWERLNELTIVRIARARVRKGE